MKDLTPRQQEVVEFIRSHIEAKYYPPTFREVADHFAISIRGVSDHIVALKKKGVLTYKPGTARTLELAEAVTEARGSINVPVLRNMTEQAVRQLFDDYRGETIAVPTFLLQGESRCFVVRMGFPPLPDLCLLEGDFLIFSGTPLVKDKQVVLALLQDGYGVRQYFDEGHRIRLGMGGSLVHACYVDKVAIAGVLIGVMRVYEKQHT